MATTMGTLVGRVVDNLIKKNTVKLHRKMSRFDSDPTSAAGRVVAHTFADSRG